MKSDSINVCDEVLRQFCDKLKNQFDSNCYIVTCNRDCVLFTSNIVSDQFEQVGDDLGFKRQDVEWPFIDNDNKEYFMEKEIEGDFIGVVFNEDLQRIDVGDAR